jgi:hypothetical protein
MKIRLVAEHKVKGSVEGDTAFTVIRTFNLPFFPPVGLEIEFSENETPVVITPAEEGCPNHIWMHDSKILDVAGSFRYQPVSKDHVEKLVRQLWCDGWHFSHLDWDDPDLRARLKREFGKPKKKASAR